MFSLISMSLLISCGGSKKNAETGKLKPEKTEISGDLSDYLQIVDNEYEIIDDWGGKLSIKIKAVKKMSEIDFKNKDINLSISLLGENGMPVSGTDELELDYSSDDKLINLLKKGSGEEVIMFKSLLGGYKAEEHADKVKKFSVSSTIIEKEVEVENNSSSNSKSSSNSDNSTTDNDNSATSTDNTNSASNENWDEALASYEKYTDDYIALIKKMKKLKGKTDNSSVMETASLMTDAIKLSQDAQEFGSKMEDAKSDLTPTQLAKYMKIQLKLTAAIAELSY